MFFPQACWQSWTQLWAPWTWCPAWPSWWGTHGRASAGWGWTAEGAAERGSAAARGVEALPSVSQSSTAHHAPGRPSLALPLLGNELFIPWQEKVDQCHLSLFSSITSAVMLRFPFRRVIFFLTCPFHFLLHCWLWWSSRSSNWNVWMFSFLHSYYMIVVHSHESYFTISF